VAWALFAVLRTGITTLSILRLRDIVLYILLYFGVLYLPHTAKKMNVRLTVFLTTLIIVMALGVFQFIYLPDSTVLRFDPVRQTWIPRIASTFAHPTVFAEYLITGAMLIIGVIISTRPWRIASLSLLLLATTLLIYFTYTRGAWIGFAVGILAIGIMYATSKQPHLTQPLLHKERRRILLWSIIILTGSIFFFVIFRFTPVGTFIRSGFDPLYASNADRIVFIVQLISQTSNSDAVIGKGLGNTISKTREGGNANAFDIASGESRTIQLSKDQTLVDNQYLKTFIEMGVVGIVLMFWLFWRFFLVSKSAYAQHTIHSRVLGIFGIGFLVAFIIQALFVDIWDIYPTNALFWISAALIMSCRNEN